MKKIILSAFACLLAFGVSAQGKWGIQAGANFTDLKLSEVSMSDDMFSRATGYSAGLTYDINLPLGLGINTGLLFIQRKVESEVAQLGGDGSKTFENRYSSLELPLNVKYRFMLPVVTPFIIAGPYLDCGLWAKQDGRKMDYGDDLERFTWGMTVGAGVDVFRHIRVMYQYDWGLTDLSAREAMDNITTKPRSQRLTLGILF